jgi:hypothetical protein
MGFASMKVCNKCLVEQPLANFTPRVGRKPGAVISKCRDCMRLYSAGYKERNREEVRLRNAARMVEYRKHNHEKVLESATKYRDANREKVRAYYHENKESERQRRTKYLKENPHKPRDWDATRRATKLQRTPAWSDRKLIVLVYAYAKWLEEFAGVPCQVDHIVPLQGVSASGLHCANNLQVITRSDNSAKRNKVDPDSCATPSAINDEGFRCFLREVIGVSVDK